MFKFITTLINKVKLKMVKKLIAAACAALFPALYSLIISKWPDFPLSSNDLIEALVWAVGLFFSGGFANAAKVEFKQKQLLKP